MKPDKNGKYEDKEYFKGVHIGLFVNRIRFDNKKFGEEAIIKEVEMSWVPVQT